MPSRTNTDIIRELEIKVALLTGQDEESARRLDRIEDRIDSMTDKLQEIHRELAVLQDFKTRSEE